MSLCRSIAFLGTSALPPYVELNARESPTSIEGLQLNNRFDYINGPSSSKGDDYSIAPLRPSSPNTKLGV